MLTKHSTKLSNIAWIGVNMVAASILTSLPCELISLPAAHQRWCLHLSTAVRVPSAVEPETVFSLRWVHYVRCSDSRSSHMDYRWSDPHWTVGTDRCSWVPVPCDVALLIAILWMSSLLRSALCVLRRLLVHGIVI